LSEPSTGGRTRDFASVLAEVKPEAERLLAEYPQRRSALLPILRAFQNVEGWLSPEAMSVCAAMVGEPLSVVESTASFYTLFYRRPIGKYMLQPCRNLSCTLRGAEPIMAHFRERLGVEHLQTTDDGLFSYEEVECLAACDRAPCMQVNLEFVFDLTADKVDAILAAMREGRYEVAALPQSAVPAKSWLVTKAPAKRSPGALRVASPDAPGGMGDRSGAQMVERLVEDPYPVVVRPTRERLVTDGAALLANDRDLAAVARDVRPDGAS